MNLHFLWKPALFIFGWGAVQTTASQEQPVEVRIDPAVSHQYIEGFGTCVIDYMDTPSFYDDPKLYDLAVNDLGMSILRMSFPQELEEVNDDDDPDHFHWPAFRMPYLERRMKIAVEFKKRGLDRFIFSTWSPSSFIKTNRSTVQGGYVKMDMYEEYAENIAACILAVKQNWGIDVGAFSIQNESMFIEPYKSCLYNPYSAREAVRALKRKFEKEKIATRIQLPEDMMFFDRMYAYILPTMEDREISAFKGGFCTHRQQEWEEVVKWKEATARFGRQTWMTETSGHKADWGGALKMATDMYDYLVGGNMSAWLYWQLSDQTSSSDYALMNETEPNCKYYAAKHFYKWVRPGERIGSFASHDIWAGGALGNVVRYQNLDGVKKYCDIGIGSLFQPFYLLLHRRTGRQHDKGNGTGVFVVTDFFTQLGAAYFRHQQIADDKLRTFLHGQPQSFFPVRGFEDVIIVVEIIM